MDESDKAAPASPAPASQPVSEVTAPVVASETDPATVTPPRKSLWRKLVVGSLAALGLVFVVVIAAIVWQGWRERQAPIAETETIDAILSSMYGRYDEAQKGWLYVGSDKRSYVVRVVHQVQLHDGQPGDGLYFVVSGTPLDGRTGHVYGIFHVTRNAQTGELEQVARSERFDWGVPLTPERVRFEALSDAVWGWVLKLQNTADEPDTQVVVTNVVLAPHDAEIAELARFRSAITTRASVGCAQAERDHADWEARMENESLRAEQEAAQAASAAAASAASGPALAASVAQASDEDEDEGTPAEYEPGEEPPIRCDAATWTYRTDPIREGGAFTPLHVRQSGLLDGQPLPEKSWKLVFDPKAYVYLVPDELK